MACAALKSLNDHMKVWKLQHAMCHLDYSAVELLEGQDVDENSRRDILSNYARLLR